MAWIIYNDANHPDEHKQGEIELVYEGALERASECLKENQSILPTEYDDETDPSTQFVGLGTLSLAMKSVLPLSLDKSVITADGQDVAVLSGLPVPFTVSVNHTPVVVDDGTLEVASSQAGVIRLLVQHAAHVEESFVINAV